MAPYLVMSNKDETELLQKTMRGPSHTKVSWTWAIILRKLSDVTNIMSIQNTLARPSGWTPPLPHFIDVEVWLFCCSNKLLGFFFHSKAPKNTIWLREKCKRDNKSDPTGSDGNNLLSAPTFIMSSGHKIVASLVQRERKFLEPDTAEVTRQTTTKCFVTSHKHQLVMVP